MAERLQDLVEIESLDPDRDWLYVKRGDGNSPETLDDHKIRASALDAGTIYDFGGNLTEPPLGGSAFAFSVLMRDVTIPADFASADGRDVAQAGMLPGGSNPDADFEIALFVGMTQIGTVTVSSAGALTWATTGNVAIDLDRGNVVAWVAPDQGTGQDISIAGWSFGVACRVRAPGT